MPSTARTTPADVSNWVWRFSTSSNFATFPSDYRIPRLDLICWRCGCSSPRVAPDMRLSDTSHHGLVSLKANSQHFGRIAFPPVLRGENLRVAVAGITGGFHHGAAAAQVD